MSNKIIVLTGATASGKTNLAIKLAKKIKAQIICADSRIVYKNIDIASAKPTIQEQDGIIHHLIDIIEPTKEFSAGDFVNLAKEKIEEIKLQGDNIIITGGTWFYIKSLLDKKELIPCPINKNLREELSKLSSIELWEKLNSLDENRAQLIHPNNKDKIIRSIEIIENLGCPIKNFEKKDNIDYCAKWYMPNIEREALYEKINKRVDIMMDNGLFEEWKKNKELYPNSKILFNTIGYREFFDLEKGLYENIEIAIEKIKQHTRNFDKMIKYAIPYFESLNEAKKLVRECEKDFEARLSLLTEQVYNERDLKVITLSGPTCSGKTTASKKLVEDFSKYSKRINIISIDDFYYDKEKLHEISAKKGIDKVDYDSVDTIDLDLLKKVVEEIFDGEQGAVHTPIFDFVEGKRIGYRSLDCTDDDLFVFEGIQALYPEVHRLFEEHTCCDIFICVESMLDVGGIVFEPNEIRLLRRLVRDQNFRATSPDLTFNLWDGVRDNEEKHIFPYASNCKYRIDSIFPCEISLLKPFLSQTLPLINVDSTNYPKAQEILRKIDNIAPISKEYLSENSFYREFM